MNNNNQTKLFSYNTDIPDNGKINIPSERFIELKEKGFSEIQISVYGNARKAAIEMGYDLELFEKIRSIQSLPENVVFDFLKTRGILFKSKFEKRITF